MMTPPRLLVLAALIAATYALLNPVHDTDIFWQAKFGDLTIERGHVIRNEPFYPDVEGRPIVPIYTVAQVWYSVVRKIGGWELVKLFDAVFWALAFFIPAWTAQRKDDPNRSWPSTVALLLGAFTASKFYMTRPQTFAMLGFGCLLAILISNLSSRWKLVWGTLVLIAWQNAHPSAVVAFVPLGIMSAWGWLQWIRSKQHPPTTEILLLLIAALSVFLTPAGFDVLSLMRINTERVKQFEVTEWLPLFHAANKNVHFPAAVGLFLTVVGLTFSWKRISSAWLFNTVLFAALTVWSHRFVVFFALGVIPVWIRILKCNESVEEAKRKGNAVLVLVVAMFVVSSFILIRTGRLPLWNSWLPREAWQALKQHSDPGAVFTNTQWGGLVADEGFPRWRSLFDGRYFARTEEECDWYLRALRGELAIGEIEDRMHPVAFFLEGNEEQLIERLNKNARWRLLHRDANGVVFVRK